MISRKRHLGGFTLIEILMVIAVIGIISSGIALSATAMNQEDRIRRAAEDLEVAFQTASDIAAVKQGLLVIELVPGTDVVHIYPSVSNEKFNEPWVKDLPTDVTLDAVRIGNDVIRNKRSEILVQPSGFIQAFSIRLVMGEISRWIRWDPMIRRIEIESE